jgi:hypothetical protein
MKIDGKAEGQHYVTAYRPRTTHSSNLKGAVPESVVDQLVEDKTQA